MTAHNPFKQNNNNNKKPNKKNENTKQKEKQTKRKQNKIHGEMRKTLLTLNVTYECYS